MKNIFLRLFFPIVFLLLLLFCVSCSNSSYSITWLDADGAVIETTKAGNIYDPTLRDLPEDTDLWHYTGWATSNTGNGIICTAKKEKKQRIVWRDADGSILNELYIIKNSNIPQFDIPQDNERWIYESWKQSTEDDSTVFTANRKPNTNHFLGNVFQIVIKDANGEPLGTGSGFVINNDGWFITNDHVMNGATTAIAFFDIPDKANGSRYTQLEVLGGVYNSTEKDIFIGKLSNYETIKQYYNDIKFTEDYKVGEISYTVGYPNSSTKLEINSGTILDEYSNIYDKINGIYYVLSDSYIAPGSSGGILVSENLEVIGITTIGLYADENKQVYESGGSIPTISFVNHLTNLRETEIKKLNLIYIKGDS